MGFEVGVNCKGSIDVPFNDMDVVGRLNKFVIACSIQILHVAQKFVPVACGWLLYSGTKTSNSRLGVGSCSLASMETLGGESVVGFRHRLV